MSTRISSAILLSFALAACGSQTTDTHQLAKVEAQASADAAEDGRIACAHAEQPLTRTCTVDQTQGEHGLLLTVRHEDGGFHRLQVTHDGRGVIAADGAEAAKVTILGAEGIEVAIAGDRYRLPATIKGAKRPS